MPPPASRSVNTTMDTHNRAPKTVEHVLACHTSYIYMGGHCIRGKEGQASDIVEREQGCLGFKQSYT